MATKKSISVKVRTEKVIKALETARETRKKKVADYEQKRADYDKAVAEWEEKIHEAIKTGKVKPKTMSSRLYDGTITVVYEVPSSIKPPKEVQSLHWGLNSEIEELENAIALLKMTDEEFVSTNTYAGVARYIA